MFHPRNAAGITNYAVKGDIIGHVLTQMQQHHYRLRPQKPTQEGYSAT